jgi:Zn-dependent membrane protease YugP
MGMVTGENQQDRYRCLMGIGVALAACVLLFVAVFTDPVRVAAAEEARTQGAREKMTPAELKQWREQKLQKFNSRP